MLSKMEESSKLTLTIGKDPRNQLLHDDRQASSTRPEFSMIPLKVLMKTWLNLREDQA